MPYPGIPVGAHQCPLCLSFGRHDPNCPEVLDEDPMIDELEAEPKEHCHTCSLPLVGGEVIFCADCNCGGGD